MNPKAIPAMLSMIPSVLRGVTVRELESIKTITRKAYPSVRQIRTETLDEWQRSANESLLLVDVRKPDEFAVSHLRGAVNLRTPGEISEAMARRRPARTILYCSVGFRSSRLAHVLSLRGLENVANLEGSIFQWANEGRPLYRGTAPADKVHSYSRRWAGLLREGLADAG